MIVFKNVNSSTSHKKTPFLRLSENLRKFFLTLQFMNRFWWKFIWIPILWIRKYFIWISMTLKVIEGNKSSSNFSVNPTLSLLDGLLMLPSPNCVVFSHLPSRSLFPSLWVQNYLMNSCSSGLKSQRLLFSQKAGVKCW